MKKWMISMIVLAGGLSSCIYPFDVDLDSSVERIPVIDGNILIGGESVFALNFLTALGAAQADVAVGTGYVEDEDGKRYDLVGGRAQTLRIDTRNAPADRQYRAVIQLDGETYTSPWLTPEIPPEITDVHFTADEDNVHVNVSLDPAPNATGYIGLSYEETWEFHSDFTPRYTVDPRNWVITELLGSYPYYWCFRDVKSSSTTLVDHRNLEGGQVRNFRLLSFPRTDNRNHKLYSILVKASTLSQEAFDYNHQTEENSSSGNSLFSPEPGILTGNLRCESNPDKEVKGMVRIGGQQTKRVFLQGIYLKTYRPSEASFMIPTRDQYRTFYYDKNYRPIKDITQGDQSGIGWGPHRCINCIEAGGHQNTPDFWPTSSVEDENNLP